MKNNNAIMSIYPTRKNGVWAFDDEACGLQQEPFVGIINNYITELCDKAGLKNAHKGICLLFSESPFPGAEESKLSHKDNSNYGGAWYFLGDSERVGWLCPALYNYFSVPPQRIYVKAEKHD